jgi:hypothetical protein
MDIAVEGALDSKNLEQHRTDLTARRYVLVIVERPASDSGVLPRFYRLVRFRSVSE